MFGFVMRPGGRPEKGDLVGLHTDFPRRHMQVGKGLEPFAEHAAGPVGALAPQGAAHIEPFIV